ncbi:MAG TPA: HD domain-containing phosphohydrolase [Geobacteraceae bacterium]|nr:HD domain-containing phosphohydrolase [Geobacteraceae bacterium]
MTPRQNELFGEFVRTVVQAAGTMSLYSRQHRTTVEQASQALFLLNEALADDDSATIMRLGDDLFVNGFPLEKGPQIDRLLMVMAENGIGHFTISRGASGDDIELLLMIIARQAERDPKPTLHLRFGALDLGAAKNAIVGTAEISSISAIPAQLMEGLASLFNVHNPMEQFDPGVVLSVVAGFVTAFRNEANPFLALVPLREMDEYSFAHSINVCVLNLAQGMSLGFEGQLLHDIGVAGMLHDVGKQFIPEDILNKPGNLKENEMEYMRQHAVRGAEYLLNNPGIPRIAVVSAFEHHMKYDLSGYPKVSKGWQTNLCSQITMISDLFDALRTRRVYKDAMSFGKAAGIMLWLAGTDLNPSLTLSFLRTLQKLEET